MRSTRLSMVVLGVVAATIIALPADAVAAGGEPEVLRFDGGSRDSAAATTMDAAGNAYVGGSIEGAAPTFGVVKVGATGTAWSAVYDGAAGGVGGSALAVAVDDGGNVYAAGHIGDGVIFNNNLDYLVVALRPDGTQRWARRFDGPGSGTDIARAIAVDDAGNVYVTGSSYAAGAGNDWSTHKYGPDGALLWERRHGGTDGGDDQARDLVVRPDGSIAVTGFTKNAGDGVTNDIDTIAYAPTGAELWRRMWTDEATTDELPGGMAVDAAGRVTVTGTTAELPGGHAPSFPVTLRYAGDGTLLQTIRGHGGSAVVVDDGGGLFLAGPSASRVDATGTLVWTTPIALDSEERLRGVDVDADASGAVTVAGTISRSFNDDYLVVRFAPDGRQLWRYRFEGPGARNDRAAGVGVDAVGAAMVSGTSYSGSLSSGGTDDDIVTLRFEAGSAPALLAPTNLAAKGISSSQIRLHWIEDGGTEDGFHIERCRGNGCDDFAHVATVGQSVTTWTDSGLARNTRYAYRVRAFKADDVSAYSNTSFGKTRRR